MRSTTTTCARGSGTPHGSTAGPDTDRPTGRVREPVRTSQERWPDTAIAGCELLDAQASHPEAATDRAWCDDDERCVELFFVECDHLRDWLVGDVANLKGVTPQDLEAQFERSQALQCCNAFCNSYKHHTRGSGVTARIRDTEIDSAGVRVTIEIGWATPEATTVDALELAKECVASWRAFFGRFGIVEPGGTRDS